MRAKAWLVRLAILCLSMLGSTTGLTQAYHPIPILPEVRCSSYDRDDYSYPQSIEADIVRYNLDGQIMSPYTDEVFASTAETDIEHIVATSEAHDSGLCAASVSVRRNFARDLDNLTLASPSLNRYEKSAKDPAEWLPRLSRVWYVETYIYVKSKYGLSMNELEAQTVVLILRSHAPDCENADLQTELDCHTERITDGTVSTPAQPVVSVSQFVCTNGSVNVREGAGTNFSKVGLANSRTKYGIMSTNHNGQSIEGNRRWHRIVGEGGLQGWISEAVAPVCTKSQNSQRPPDVFERVSATPTPQPVVTSQPIQQPPPAQPQVQQRPAVVQPTPIPQPQQSVPQVTYVRNCTHARELGIAPVHRGHPAYRRALDRNNDGIGCE